MTPALTRHLPTSAFERLDEALTGDDRKAAAHAGTGNLRRITPASSERPSSRSPFDIEVACLLGIGGRFLERVPLRVKAREVGRIDVVATVLLRSENELDLTWLIHRLRIVPRSHVKQGPPGVPRP
jgi:hypothetical protein